MNACKDKRKLISELALGALAPGEAQALQAHLESCVGCREYLGEVSQLSARLRAIAKGSDIEATEAFHQRLMRAVRNAGAKSKWEAIAGKLRVGPISWRWASGLGGMAVVVTFVLLLFSRPSEVQRASVPGPPQTNQKLDGELSPSVANYRIAANRSLEQLDELLTQQANKRGTSRETYKASVLAANSLLLD
jgi:hypothetical protein